MKAYFEGVIQRKQDDLAKMEQRMKESQDIAEVRAIGESMVAMRDEIRDAEKQLASIETESEARGMDVMASYGLGQAVREEVNMYASKEYRMAFKDYVQRGVAIPQEFRAGGDNGTTVTADIGAIVPETIMNEFIKDVSKVYGQVYAKVRKLNIKGGVKFPISKLKAQFKWITETTVSDKQKAGEIKEFVEFSYNIGEIRVAQTLLSQIVSLDLFEAEVVKIMVEAYVETIDKGIISGTGSGQLLGITKDPRVTNVIEMTEAEMGDWTAWRKNLFAKIPLSKRGQGEFLFTSATVEAYLMTMKDGNDRPLFKEATELDMGRDVGRFFGRTVTLVEPDVLADFGTAGAGEVIGIMWVPQDYAINTNMAFGMKRYFDEDTNEWINKALTILDGKMVDTSGCYLIKKKVQA
ncbi:MAG: phage major capsid protein [Bacteroidales bacterium]|nr:phage major capsid protein [Bacteroidales bacterium]